jgi:hypothetical protein
MATNTERVKGQETEVLIVVNSQVQDTLTDIMNFNSELSFEIKSVGYLGEKTNRKDYIYNGAKFDFEMHTHTQDWVTFVQAQLDLAKRNTPNTQFNITFVAEYPNGDTPSFLFSNASFGALPFGAASRADYVKHKVQGEADDVTMTQS